MPGDSYGGKEPQKQEGAHKYRRIGQNLSTFWIYTTCLGLAALGLIVSLEWNIIKEGVLFPFGVGCETTTGPAHIGVVVYSDVSRDARFNVVEPGRVAFANDVNDPVHYVSYSEQPVSVVFTRPGKRVKYTFAVNQEGNHQVTKEFCR